MRLLLLLSAIFSVLTGATSTARAVAPASVTALAGCRAAQTSRACAQASRPVTTMPNLRVVAAAARPLVAAEPAAEPVFRSRRRE